MDNIAISIIVPAYNVEQKITRCLNGLVNQTFDDYEIIVVDDGSCDNTGEICKQYSYIHKNLRYILKENGGVSSARNCGIKNARGEYIAFVDSDDYVSKKLCEGMFTAAKKSDADLIVASYFTDYNGNIKKHECCREFCANNISEMKEDFEWIYRDCFLNSPWNKLFKKSIMSEYFRTDMCYFEDYYFNISFIQRCKKIKFIKDAYYYYVEDSQASLTKNFKEKTFEWITMIYRKQVESLLPFLDEDAHQLFAASLIYGLYNTTQKCVYVRGSEAIKFVAEWRNCKEVCDVFKKEKVWILAKQYYSVQITVGAYLLKFRCYRTVYTLFRLKKIVNPVIQILKSKYRNN